MENVLSKMAAVGLITELNGDDERLVKMQTASTALAKEFGKTPALLIPAILDALDSETNASTPLIQKSKAALLKAWPTYGSVYTDEPILLFRALLFDACQKASEGKNASILWLTAVDQLPHSKLGKEEVVIREVMSHFLNRMESEIANIVLSATNAKPAKILNQTDGLSRKIEPYHSNVEELKAKTGGVFAPNSQDGVAFTNPNPHWVQNNQQHWSWEAGKRLQVILTDEIEALTSHFSSEQMVIQKYLQEKLTYFQSSIQVAIHEGLNKTSSERLQLNTLWWYEALYSPSLKLSYRELAPEISTIVMAFDLLEDCTTVTPISVAYVLAEAVARLPGAGYDSVKPLTEIITQLNSKKDELSASWLSKLSSLPTEGRYSIRDVAVAALTASAFNAEELLRRAALPLDTSLSLPQFSRAIFRQEQALRLAKRG
jgi:hypothetical protein